MIPSVDAKRERDLRLLAGGLLGAAAVYQVLPVHPAIGCPLRNTTGIPCPFCGMTRGVVAAAHGHLWQSLMFNPGAIFVLVLAVALVVRPSLLARYQPPLWVVWSVLGALWVWNIGFNPTFHQLFLR